jgi:hypothetical protein
MTTLYLTFQVDSRNDGRDFDQVRNSMRYVGYSQEEISTVWKLLAAILQLVRGQGRVSYFDDLYLLFVWNR